MKYDVVIIGSGLGGLQCAYILSREGYSVCVIEKNHQPGGCLQTFKRHGSIFDTGMHYIGSMDEGQTLNRFFKYFNLTGNLKLKKLDETGYDIIRYDNREYKFACGHEQFVEKMCSYFPDEQKALQKYIEKLKEVSNSIDLYNLRDFNGTNPRYFRYFSQSIDQFLDSITSDSTLKNVLLGTSPLYAGVKEQTPLYLPMIIHSSFIASSYRFIDGGSQISNILVKSIEANGGKIFLNTETTGFEVQDGKINAVIVNNTDKIEGKNFISNLHPKKTISLLDNKYIKPAYRKRIESAEETTGMFSLYLSLKENSFRYINSNYYIYNYNNFWNNSNYNEETWPQGFMVHFSPVSENSEYTNSMIINTYMKWDEVKKWENTTVEKRGDEYKTFKQKKTEKLLNLVEKHFPGLRSSVHSVYSSTPLTYRDYIGSTKGSVYGIQKDYASPLKTMILPKTHIPNLLLTGQNINIHGVVGVTIGALLTSSELIGMPYLIKKMRDAQ